MKDRKPRVGRPTKAPKAGEKSTIGVRVSPSLKTALLAAADESDRSLSAEAEFRLEQSMGREQLEQNLLPALMAAAHGPRLGALLLILGAAMKGAGQYAGAVHQPGPYGMFGWFNSPSSFEAGIAAIEAVLRAVAPVSAEAIDDDAARRIGLAFAAGVLEAVREPDKCRSRGPEAAELVAWADTLRGYLDPATVERIQLPGRDEIGVPTTRHSRHRENKIIKANDG